MLFDREPKPHRPHHGALGAKCPAHDGGAMIYDRTRDSFVCPECGYKDAL